MNYDGILIGASSFLIIWLLHPVVIKVEYYWGTKIWPLFFIAGLVCIFFSLFLDKLVLSALLSVLGFSLLWSIKELFEQKQRVIKGWFPSNPRRDNHNSANNN